ncbi:hypothetical protein BDW62DRAFT_183736 [Aspergillus aurantiobrunneus]
MYFAIYKTSKEQLQDLPKKCIYCPMRKDRFCSAVRIRHGRSISKTEGRTLLECGVEDVSDCQASGPPHFQIPPCSRISAVAQSIIIGSLVYYQISPGVRKRLVPEVRAAVWKKTAGPLLC